MRNVWEHNPGDEVDEVFPVIASQRPAGRPRLPGHPRVTVSLRIPAALVDRVDYLRGRASRRELVEALLEDWIERNAPEGAPAPVSM